ARAGLPRGSTLIMAIAETPLGMLNAFELAQTGRVWCVTGGYGSRSGDAAKSIGYRWTGTGLEKLTHPTNVVLADGAAGGPLPIGVCSLELDAAAMRTNFGMLRDLGYRGALVIHPSSVAIANEVFSPSAEEIEWNRQVVLRMAEATSRGHGAAVYDGMMIDGA